MKKIGPQITEETEFYLLSNFRNLNAGSEYIMQALPHITKKFFGLDIKGRFSHDEICLMIDVMNGTALTPRSAGQHILLNVQDGMKIDHLDQKWRVDGSALIEKLSGMSTPDLMFLEVWIAGFWNQNGKITLEKYIKPLLAD
jgi:hypothetical protein